MANSAMESVAEQSLKQASAPIVLPETLSSPEKTLTVEDATNIGTSETMKLQMVHQINLPDGPSHEEVILS